MYWPNGVPRAYAVNGSSSRLPAADGEGDNNDEASGNARDRSNSHAQRPSRREYSEQWADEPINGLCVSRSGHLFATMTESSISIWQTRPTAVVAAVTRSQSSLKTYGTNIALLLRPDSAILVVQTLHGYLITYSIATDPNARVYQQRFGQTQNRRQQQQQARHLGSNDANGVREVSIRFRMAIKVDAGISTALALENELVVATVKPAAIQCIRWTPDRSGTQTNTELLSRMSWMSTKSTVVEMVYDRAMNLLVWISGDGHAYAVQRGGDGPGTEDEPRKLFRGHCFHAPENEGQKAVQAAVNARFSLLAVSCANGEIYIYTAKDYLGNIPLSHKLSLPASFATTGPVTFMSYSPDGYCLFAGYERGWSMWSVFGKPGGNSFTSDRSIAGANGEKWLEGISMGCWIGGGSDIVLTAKKDPRLWILETARSALTGCFSSTNLVRALLQTGTEIILYRGHDLPDLTTISGKDSLWHHAQYPPPYLHSQWPIRSCIVSQDGRYVAIAGRRGLAHYSVNSGRWKTFEDSKVEDSFAVRGGMCWYGHILIAAIESDDSYELRMYSRELALNNSSILHIETLPAPVVFIGPSGEDSLLVYTYDNVLYHYIINSSQNRISLVQVGQIAFHGIVRAPTRVRSISWILPDNQLRNGDPSQDVAVASVLFLVDGKLVLLQPSVSNTGDLKYDMRIVAHDVEYYILMRDQLAFNFAPPVEESHPPSPSAESALSGYQGDLSLRDSLWTFCGKDLLTWSDVQDILRPPTEGISDDVSKPLAVPVDFYPLSILLSKGIILGVESEMIQRRDTTFAVLRFAIRTHLFLPYFLQHNLAHLDMPAALALCHNYSGLSYFPHALEILLHHVLDDEVDNQATDEKLPGVISPPRPLLPSVLSFLQASIPTPLYLDILVQCTRKTELRSWRTLFAHLPPPKDLFEQALKINSLKTAGGYLLVLQEFADDDDDDDDGEKEGGGGEDGIEDYVVRLLKLASQKGDWDLCKELARFLIALDASGRMLRSAVAKAGLNIGNGDRKLGIRDGPNGPPSSSDREPNRGLGLGLPTHQPSASTSTLSPDGNYHRREDSDISTSSAGTATTAPQQ